MRIFMLVHWTFEFMATPAQTKDEVRLKLTVWKIVTTV